MPGLQHNSFTIYLMKIFSTLFSLIFTLFFGRTLAQKRPILKPDQYYVESTFLSLKSTHHNYFNGSTFFIGNNISEKFNLAVGYEHSRNKFHNDNDWFLYKLRFNSIVFRQQYAFLSKEKFTLSGDLREGFSFIKYIKEEPLINKNYRFPVKEHGLYLYAGLDSKIKLSRNLAIVLDLGLKGLHMSTNVYEVNPHGLNIMTGLQVNL